MKKTFSISMLGLVAALLSGVSGNPEANAAKNARANSLKVDAPVNVERRAAAGDYVLVKSASELVVGRKVIIAASAYNYAMSATQSTNNRSRVAITKKTSGSDTIATWSGNVGVFTLSKGSTSGTYAFYDANKGGYLYAASSSKDYLKTSSSLSANASFSISISSGAATVYANGSYTHKYIKYNSSSGVFSCYTSSSQKPVAIYQQAAESAPSTVAVTGVALNKSSANLEIGETLALNATVSPSTATNKTVTWASSNSSVASVSSSGLVTALAAGSSTISVATADGNYKASCVVTVSKPAAQVSGNYDLQPAAFPTSYGSYAIEVDDMVFTTYYVRKYSSYIQFYKSKGYVLNNEAIDGLASITLNTYSGYSFSGTLYSGSSAGSTTHSQSCKNGYTYTIPAGDTFFAILVGSSTGYLKSITVTYSKEDVSPTSISLAPTSVELKQGGQQQLSVEYAPANVNTNKGVTYSSNNSNVTVSSTGLVKVSSSAAVGTVATITATSTYNSALKATCKVTVVDTPVVAKAAWTIMIYMCGADLESTSNYRLATGDIKEILSVAGQTSDVNIIIETGGAKSWASTYGVSASYLQRWHVSNKQLVLDASLTKANMGLQSTFQSFLEWGLTEYPAEKTGVIMWNHGGAMRGVCYDENFNDDCLLNNEVNAAVAGAFANTGRTQKLEFIGYDACLMSVQDVAEFNSQYFNYMVASEESEAGYGWDYDTWVDDLYAKKSTTTILKAIVDGFIADNGGTSSSSNNQTLAYLDLSKMAAYKTAWENMASALAGKLTSSNKSSFNSLVKSCKYYADSDYTYFGIFDAKDFINKLAANSTFNPGSTYTNAVLTAHANLVGYSSCGRKAGNSYGICMFWSVSSNCAKSSYYTANQTNFTNWRNLVVSYGQ